MNHLDPTTSAWLGDILLQVSLLLAASLIANLALRRASAAWRHALLLSTVVGVPVLLGLSAVLPIWKLPNSDLISASFATESSVTVELAQPTAPLVSSLPAETIIAPPPEVGSGAEFAIYPVLITIWLLGVGVLWLRLIAGIVALTCRRSPDQGIPHRLSSLIACEASNLGLKDLPRVVLLDDAAMPMTWRIHRHFLALPSTAAEWPEERLRNIVRHELAHMRRNDCHSLWLADACVALLWFHPLAWRVRHALGNATESACDDLTLGRAPDQNRCNQYASDLLNVVSSHSRQRRAAGTALALAMANNGHRVRHRIEMILDPRRSRQPMGPRARWLASPVWLAGLAALASLAACRSSDSSTSPRTSGSHVQVSLQAFESEDPALLEELFQARSEGPQFTGILTAEQTAELFDQLAKNGMESKSKPSVVTGLDQVATVQLCRELIYPTEYSPPELPDNVESSAETESSFPVTPAMPTNFEVREVGLSFEVKPSPAGAEGIKLDFALSDTLFLGFVNYGSPIKVPSKDFFGRPIQVVVTENRIAMPVFQSQRINSKITAPFGSTIAIVAFAPQGDPNFKKVIDETDEVDSYKHTLYLIRPEYVDEPAN